MPSSTQIAEYRRTLEQVRRAAAGDIAALWALAMDPDADKAKRVLMAEAPTLIGMWADVAAVVTADAYSGWRLDAGVTGRRSSVLADPVAVERIDALVRWSMSPMYQADQDPDGVRSRLANGADRLVADQSDETMRVNAGRDNARFAWVPSSGKACAWCQMLASRGPVFASRDMGRHDHCSCAVVPVWSDADLPASYDAEAYYRRYWEAKLRSGSKETTDILAQMRVDLGVN